MATRILRPMIYQITRIGVLTAIVVPLIISDPSSINAQDSKLSSPEIEAMTVLEIAEYINNLPKTVSSRVMVVLTRRLYDIAYFDHHVSREDRNSAILLFQTVKKTVEDGWKDEPEALSRYHEALAAQEQSVPIFGYGSLAFLIDEYDIPSDDIVPFIMQPKYAHLLANFLTMLNDETKTKTKPELVRELIYTRHYSGVGNSVLALHGIVAIGDQAALAIFSPNEITTLERAPSDYKRARQILVALGLLPKIGSARSFFPQLDEKILNFIIYGTARLDDERFRYWDDELIEFYRKQDDEGRNLLDVASMVVRIYAFWQSITDIYGDAMGAKTRNATLTTMSKSRALGIESWFNLLDRLERGNEFNEEYMAKDIEIAVAFMTLGEFFQDTETVSYEEEEFAYTFAKLLNFDRVYSIYTFRLMIRWFVHNYPDVSDGKADDIWKILADMYVLGGSFLPEVERRTYFEDWIGIPSD